MRMGHSAAALEWRNGSLLYQMPPGLFGRLCDWKSCVEILMNPPQPITALDLRDRLAQMPELRLIDVRLQDDYDSAHLPGAISNCVFEVAFLDRMEAAVPDKNTPVCVYGWPNSKESATAAGKLIRAGYETVFDFQEGIDGWSGQGFPLAWVIEPQETPIKLDLEGDHEIDLQESRVEWLGRNLLNKHWGRIGVKSGKLSFDGGDLIGGEFVLNMNELTCSDLEGHPLHDVLIHHLKSDDFFDVENFPEAKFRIRAAEEVPGSHPGTQNLKVTGDLTLRGITHPIEFGASVGLTPDERPAAQAAFSIDRTKWGVLYGSGGFFKRLAHHLVNDQVELHLRIVGKA